MIKPILMTVVLPILKLVFEQVLPRVIGVAIKAIALFSGVAKTTASAPTS